MKQKIQRVLEKNDYVTCEYKGCFDVAAKKDNILLVKTLLNVDAFQKEQAKNLKIVSNNLDACPLLVGMQTNREKLKKGIVYERFDMPTVSLETFRDLISNQIFPRIYRDRGGLYVKIDSELLRETRNRKNLTQRKLAEMVGINKKVIYEHEKLQLRMFLNIAKKLERVLNKKMIQPIELLRKYQETGHPRDILEKRIGKDLEKLGFETNFVKQAPIDVFAKEKVLILSDIETNKRRMKKRALDLKEFINLINKPALFITEEHKGEILGIPVLKRKELEEFENSRDLIRLVRK
jgi:putative transcriptional regulator